MFAFLLLMPIEANSQRKRNQKQNNKSENVSLNAFKFRNIGPAFLSGRVKHLPLLHMPLLTLVKEHKTSFDISDLQ